MGQYFCEECELHKESDSEPIVGEICEGGADEIHREMEARKGNAKPEPICANCEHLEGILEFPVCRVLQADLFTYMNQPPWDINADHCSRFKSKEE